MWLSLNRYWICLVLIMAIQFSLSGCATTHEAEYPYPVKAKPLYPSVHVWKPLFATDQEKQTNYGMYTYVLINQDVQEDEASKKYKALIAKIETSTASRENFGIEITEQDYNIFLIPYTRSVPYKINSTLSKKLLTIFSLVTTSEKIKQAIASHPGPFLISTPAPINRLKAKAEIPTLYLDLTNASINVVKEIVSAYKKRIVTAPINSEEKFNSIRLAILNILLTGDDCISIVKAAYAEWKD